MFASRSRSRAATFCTSAGSPAFASFSSSSFSSTCCGSLSPSSFLIAFICSRRKNSRWFLPKVSLTWLWICAPRRSTSRSRFSSSVTRFRRDFGEVSASSACRSSRLRLRFAAIRSDSGPGSSVLTTAIFSSSGSVGDSVMTSWKRCAAFRSSARTSIESSLSSGRSL